MKKISIILISAILVTFISSCQKTEDDQVFSCNPETNQWAHANQKNLQVLDRNEIAQLPISKQRAAWRTFTPERKYNLWKEKYTEMMNLNWSDQERTHLELLINQLCVEFFMDPTSIEIIEKQNNFDHFIEVWLSYAQNSLGWSNDLLFSIGLRLDNPSNSNKLLKTQSGSYTDESGNPPDPCTCNASNAGNDFCGAFDMLECKAGGNGCSPSLSGCGWLWRHKCDGMCMWKTPEQ